MRPPGSQIYRTRQVKELPTILLKILHLDIRVSWRTIRKPRRNSRRRHRGELWEGFSEITQTSGVWASSNHTSMRPDLCLLHLLMSIHPIYPFSTYQLISSTYPVQIQQVSVQQVLIQQYLFSSSLHCVRLFTSHTAVEKRASTTGYGHTYRLLTAYVLYMYWICMYWIFTGYLGLLLMYWICTGYRPQIGPNTGGLWVLCGYLMSPNVTHSYCH